MPSRPPFRGLPVRVGLVLAAVLACVWIAGLERDRDRCSDAGRTVFLGPERQSRQTFEAAVRTLDPSCAHSPAMVSSSTSLLRVGREADAARLARMAARAEPDNWSAWAALGLALRSRDPGGSRRALARARELNPLEAPPPG